MVDTTAMLAFLLLSKTCGPDFSKLQMRIAERIENSVSVDEPSAISGTLLYRHGNYLLSVIPMDLPLPADQNDTSLASMRSWPGAAEALEKHKAHVSLGVAGGDSGRERALLLQKLIVATSEACPETLGLFYTNAETLWPAELVVESAKAHPETVLEPVFVFAQLAKTERKGEISATTTGLSAFGLMEIETEGFTGSPEDLNATVHNFAAYLIDEGPVVKDGDTIGPDAATKFTVHHAPSTNVAGEKVYRLSFAGTPKKKGFFGLFQR